MRRYINKEQTERAGETYELCDDKVRPFARVEIDFVRTFSMKSGESAFTAISSLLQYTIKEHHAVIEEL